MPIVSNTFSNGQIITHSELNENFTDLEAYLTGIRDADIAPDAGITSRKLLDRFAPTFMTIPLLPASQAATLTAGGGFYTVPDVAGAGSSIAICRAYPEFRAGRRCYLVAVSVYALEFNAANDRTPVIFTYQNTTNLTGTAGINMTNTGPWILKNSDPYGAPLAIFDGGTTPGDYVEIKIARSATGGTCGLRGLWGTLTFKNEVTS